MLTKKNIENKAGNVSYAKQSIFAELKRRIFSDISAGSAEDWQYNTVTHEYSKTYSLWGVEKICYTELEEVLDDIRLTARYDYYDELMYGTVCIPENTETVLNWVHNILRIVSKRRTDLHKKWNENAREVIAKYFEDHKKEFLEFPLAFCHGFRTKSFTLWCCRGESDDMRKELGVLTNQVTEHLSERDFFPSFWSTGKETDVTVNLNGYELHVHRHFAPDLEDFTHDWPDVSVTFELTYSEKSEWANALGVIRYHNENDKHLKYRDFKEHLEEKAEWQYRTKDGKHEIYAYIPVIYSDYIEFICKEAKREYRGVIEVKGHCQRYVPFFEDEMTCIEVVLI